MNVRAEIDPKDIARLQNLFAMAEKESVHYVEGLIQQTMLFALKSAAIATKPRRSAGADGRRRGGGLQDKDMYRPLVPLPASMGNWYYEVGVYKPFKVEKRALSRREMKQKNLKKITKAIKMWDRSGAGWKYLPYAGTKRNKRDFKFWIRRPGLAKEGWLRAAKGVDGKFHYESLRYNKNVHGIHVLTKGFLFMMAANRVRYVSKSSPASARYGLNKATNRMEKIWLPKIDAKIQRRFN